MRANTSGVTCPSRLGPPRRVLTLLMVLLVTAASASAFARDGGGRRHSGGHHSSGAHIGGHRSSSAHTGGHHFSGPRIGLGVIVAAPVFWYYPPPPYYPMIGVTPTAPLVYIEQGSAPSAPDLAAGYWYYCADAQAYYPYVKECAGAWQPVAPQAPQGQ